MRKVRRRWFVLVAFALGLISSALADEPQFLSLFNGKTLEGWSQRSTDHFSVKNEVLFGDGGTGWLRSEKRYKNFEFRSEYRALKAGADSGVFFRASAESTENAPNWPRTCYQLQISDAENNLMIFGHATTVKFDRKADALESVSKRQGEWQALRLTVIGNRATVHLNDTLITESDGITIEEGHLGIQGENGQFEWRELKIRELP